MKKCVADKDIILTENGIINRFYEYNSLFF